MKFQIFRCETYDDGTVSSWECCGNGDNLETVITNFNNNQIEYHNSNFLFKDGRLITSKLYDEYWDCDVHFEIRELPKLI